MAALVEQTEETREQRSRGTASSPAPASGARIEPQADSPTAAGRSAQVEPDRSGQASVLGYGVVGIVLMGYFAWICIEMAGHAAGGVTLVVTIAASVGLACAALVVGTLAGRRSGSAAASRRDRAMPNGRANALETGARTEGDLKSRKENEAIAGD